MLSLVRLFVTPLTVAHQAPLSIGLPCKNTGVSCYSLLQGIFLIQGSDLCLLPLKADSLPLSHQGSPHSFIPRLVDSEAHLSKPVSYLGGKTWMGGRCGTPFSWQPFAHFLPSIRHLPATEAQNPAPSAMLSAFTKLGQPGRD